MKIPNQQKVTNSEACDETALMHRLDWAFGVNLCDKLSTLFTWSSPFGIYLSIYIHCIHGNYSVFVQGHVGVDLVKAGYKIQQQQQQQHVSRKFIWRMPFGARILWTRHVERKSKDFSVK